MIAVLRCCLPSSNGGVEEEHSPSDSLPEVELCYPHFEAGMLMLCVILNDVLVRHCYVLHIKARCPASLSLRLLPASFAPSSRRRLML